MALPGFTQREFLKARGRSSPAALSRARNVRRITGGGGAGFTSRRGFIPKRGAVREGGRGGGPTAEELAAAFLAASGGGGGGGGRSQADELSLIREQARLGSEESSRERAAAERQAELNRAFERAQEQKRLEEERRQQAAALQAQRQEVFNSLIGKDPVRAILFAMGIGPEADIFSTQINSLGATQTPLAGVGQSKLQTETALSGLLGRSIQLGAGGVSNLGGAEQAAQAFQSGGAQVQNLLTSAFGVGGTRGAGISAEELIQRIGAVTPTGVLQQ